MQYEIAKDGNMIDSGTFDIRVIVKESTQYRNKIPQEVTKYTSEGKPYKAIEYRCP